MSSLKYILKFRNPKFATFIIRVLGLASWASLSIFAIMTKSLRLFKFFDHHMYDVISLQYFNTDPSSAI